MLNALKNVTPAMLRKTPEWKYRFAERVAILRPVGDPLPQEEIAAAREADEACLKLQQKGQL